MSELSENLKRLRGDETQTQFAAMLGIKQQTYANYELGLREPDIDTLCRIAKILGKSVDELVGMRKMSADRNANKVADLKKAIIALLKEY